MMFGFVAIGLMSVEYFPTEISSTSIGIIDCISCSVNIFMPFFVNLMHDLHLHPVAFTTFILLLCGVVPIIRLKNAVENPHDDLSDIIKSQTKEN